MVIAVNTRVSQNEPPGGNDIFIAETFKRIIADHPEHSFVFLHEHAYVNKIEFGAPVQHVIAGKRGTHPLLWRLWYDIKLPRLIRKYNAEVLISFDGSCSLGTSLPQIMVIRELAFLHDPASFKRSQLFFYKKNMPRFLEKAKTIATLSAFTKKEILRNYNPDPGKIDTVYTSVKEIFHPLTAEEKMAIKNKYTGGREYFVYTGSIHPGPDLINLLKAFSLFKKRQQTNMKLLVAGRIPTPSGKFRNDLRSYKYRDDVVLIETVTDDKEFARITAAAYALVYPSSYEGVGEPVLEAMRSGVPVITTTASAMEELAGDAALYVDGKEPASIAGKMMLLYKDEKLHNEMIRKGAERAREYSWEKTAGLLWKTILKAMG